MSCAPDMMKIQTFRSERDMDDRLSNAVGYDSKDAPRTQRKAEQR